MLTRSLIKSFATLTIFSALLLFFGACEEIPPRLNIQEPSGGGGQTGSGLEDQLKGVLVEEFTGVRCVNCPAGADAITQLKSIHNERLVPVSLHAGFFSRPYDESLFDFRTNDADAIQNYVGIPGGYPSASVDRFKFDGEATLQVALSTWAGYIDQQLRQEPAMGIGLELAYSADNRELTVTVDLLGRSDSQGRDAFLTVQLLEDKIEDYQLKPEGKDPNYVHKHVFRESITSTIGDLIGPIVNGATDQKTFTVEVSEDYVVDNLEIVAFVHYADGDENGKEILQAVSQNLAL